MPSPLTQEQLDYFAAECKTSFKRGARWASKRATVGYAILLLGVFGMYWNGQHVSGTERGAIVESGRAVTVSGCNRDYRSIERLRGLLSRAEDATKRQAKSGDINQHQAAQARAFYSSELNKLPLPDCRKAKFTLTADPNKPVQVPVPLHPPDKA